MQITLELPDDIALELSKINPDVSRSVLEGFAVEGYRSGVLTAWQVRQLLGFNDRFELDAFLKAVGLSRDFTAEELERDFQNSRIASGAANRS